MRAPSKCSRRDQLLATQVAGTAAKPVTAGPLAREVTSLAVQRLAEPRVTVIEGRRTLVVERRPPLPPRLDQLLSHLKVYPIRITGWRGPCAEQDHRLTLFAEGLHDWPDASGQIVRRRLRLFMCRDCESVQVRDITLDRLPGQRDPASAPPRRRDHVIGWYSGARRSQRQYS